MRITGSFGGQPAAPESPSTMRSKLQAAAKALQAEPLPPIKPKSAEPSPGKGKQVEDLRASTKPKSAEPKPPQTPGIMPVGRRMRFDFRPNVRTHPRIAVRGKPIGKKVAVAAEARSSKRYRGFWTEAIQTISSPSLMGGATSNLAVPCV